MFEEFVATLSCLNHISLWHSLRSSPITNSELIRPSSLSLQLASNVSKLQGEFELREMHPVARVTTVSAVA